MFNFIYLVVLFIATLTLYTKTTSRSSFANPSANNVETINSVTINSVTINSVTINSVTIPGIDYLEIARTPSEVARGLMFRKTLDNKTGMLFVFPKGSRMTFWMKNTYVSLDMIFLDADGRILTIHQHTRPLDTSVSYGCDQPFYYVLETRAGFAKRHHLRVGDELFRHQT